MSASPDSRTELLDLLDAWCDERLTPAQAARLEEIVRADRSARRIYLEYVHLHGTLLWDAAQGDVAAADVSETVQTTVRVPVPEPPRRARRAWVLTIAGTACLAAVAAVGWWQRGPHPHVPVVVADPPDADELASTDGPRRGPHFRPVELPDHVPRTVVLDRPAAVVAPTPAPGRPADLVAFIDERIEQGWEDAGLEPSPLASDSEWLRRVTLDLAGRIPSADEVNEFLSDSASEKKSRVVDRLLRSEEFERHFASVWTNLLVGRAESRLADRGALFRFLQQQFGSNRGWDEIVAAFVAAEGPIDADPAANFLVAHLNNQAVPATAITARVFLGTQVQCMQCHNHPFNDWTQQDFWELNSFFQQTQLKRDDRGKPTLVSAKVGGPTLFETRNGLMKAAYPIYEGQSVADEPTVNRRVELAKLLSQGDKPQLALAFVNRTWAQLLGAGFVNPVEDMGPHNPPTHPRALDELTRAFVESGYDVRQLVRWIASTRAYQLSSRFGEKNVDDDPEQGFPPLFSRTYPKPMSVEQVYDSLLVATRADRAELGSLASRDEWVRQFVTTYETDENDESVNFDGSVPAALALMNGDLVKQNLRPEPGTTLHLALNSPGNESVKLNKLALATLNRPLSPKETAAFRRLIRQTVASAPPARRQTALVEAYQDALWAMLNSGEFATVP